ncbi:MAG: DUF2269 family protein [Chloroflexi bacterium]|nr:DUF2269 family protein [Chloroflexota bacterium]
MSPFLALKVVHIVLAILAVGTSVTSTFWLARAGVDRDRLVWALDGARLFDRRIANPAYVLVLLTGIAMVATGTYRFDQGWIDAAIGLYLLIAAFGIVVFRPAARLQRAEAAADPTSAAYARIAARTWWYSWLTVAVVAMIVVLMVTKPI